MRRDYQDELLNILNSNLTDLEKKEAFDKYHENDIADLIEILDKDKRNELYRILGNEMLAEILSYADDIGELVEEMSADEAADIIEMMDADDAIDVLMELDEEQRSEIESLMDDESIQDIQEITRYDENQIGSRMTNNFIVISKSDTIKQAMKKVISQAQDNDNINSIYVLSDIDKYYGVVELRDLIRARENDLLEDIIKNYPFIIATDDVGDCIIKFKEYEMDSYPVLNDAGQLLGVITLEDVVEAVDDEMSDDYAKLAGLTEEENIKDSVFASVRKRLPWLVILLILGLVQSFAMTTFEHIIAALPIIVFFQTLVLSMSGNSGTQSLAVTIRVLSDEEDSGRKIRKTVFKELRTGFLNGLALGIIAFIIVFVFMYITKQSIGTNVYQVMDAIKASGIVAFSLLIAMTLSSCVGALIPIIFLKIGVDPAVASGPFITTISDVTALLIYYGLAYLMFLAF